MQALGEQSSPRVRTVRLVVPAAPDMSVSILEGRLTQIIRENDVFRTAFVRPAGFDHSLQTVDDAAVVTVENHGESSPDTVPFDPDLSRGACLQVALASGRLVLTAVAAVADEQSLRLVAAQLLGASTPEDSPLQLVDYASWEAEQADDDGADARIARGYWSGLAVETDADHALPVLETQPVEIAGVELDAETWLAAWAAVRGRYAADGADRVVLALAVDGRVDDDLRLAVGPYERYVPFVVADDPRATLAELAVRVRADRSAAARFAAHAPPPVADAAFAERGDDAVTPARGAFPLELVVVGRRATLWYAPDRVEAAAVERMAAQLRALAAARDIPAASVDVRGAAERAALDRWLTGNDLTPPTGSVPAAVAAHVAARPDAIAVASGADSLTYAELDRRSAALAAALPGHRAPVAIVLERSVDLIVAALAVLRSGAPYLALEPGNPPERIAEQLRIAGATVVITASAHADLLPLSAVPVLVDARPVLVDDMGPATPGAVPVDAGDTAYLIFTSGSTGTPKAVAVTHANVLAYVRSVSALLGLDATVRFAAVTGLSTDLGNTAVFGALLNGGTLEVVPDDVVVDGEALGRLIAERGVTAMKITPSHLRAVLGATASLPVPTLVIGGEALNADLVARARAANVGRVINHYGPTETTVGVLAHELPADVTDPVPLGRPLAHVRAHVLDRHGMPAPLGAVGQLAIGGPAVAAGYVGRPDETAARFVAEPGHPGAVMYLTGDLVRVRDDGLLEFHGRADDQVKIRGFRVELGEIEARLCAAPAVKQAAVAVDDDVLVAYVVADGAVDAEALRSTLAMHLPGHMVPQAFVPVPHLPLTPSGKVDRRALSSVAHEAPAPARQITAPRTETEAALLAIWHDVLPRTDVGVEDNFFQVGGHSLLATKVIARTRAHFAVELPLYVIFAKSTVADMAADIDERRGALADTGDEDLAALLDELETMSDADAEQLLRNDSPQLLRNDAAGDDA